MLNARRREIRTVAYRQLAGGPRKTAKRLAPVLVCDLHIGQRDVGDAKLRVDTCIRTDRAGTTDDRRVDGAERVAAPTLGCALCWPVDHPLNQCLKVRNRPRHLLVKPHRAQARQPGLGHHNHRLPQRQFGPNVQENEPQQSVGVAKVCVAELGFDLLVLRGERLVKKAAIVCQRPRTSIFAIPRLSHRSPNMERKIC